MVQDRTVHSSPEPGVHVAPTLQSCPPCCLPQLFLPVLKQFDPQHEPAEPCELRQLQPRHSRRPRWWCWGPGGRPSPSSRACPQRPARPSTTSPWCPPAITSCTRPFCQVRCVSDTHLQARWQPTCTPLCRAPEPSQAAAALEAWVEPVLTAWRRQHPRCRSDTHTPCKG